MVDIECPTGKRAFRTRADATRHRPRRLFGDGKRVVHAFRCGYCGYLHLGKRR